MCICRNNNVIIIHELQDKNIRKQKYVTERNNFSRMYTFLHKFYIKSCILILMLIDTNDIIYI